MTQTNYVITAATGFPTIDPQGGSSSDYIVHIRSFPEEYQPTITFLTQTQAKMGGEYMRVQDRIFEQHPRNGIKHLDSDPERLALLRLSNDLDARLYELTRPVGLYNLPERHANRRMRKAGTQTLIGITLDELPLWTPLNREHFAKYEPEDFLAGYGIKLDDEIRKHLEQDYFFKRIPELGQLIHKIIST
ncbi:hypothetical protein HYV86_01625 [Candidatus Woesearchaeota archaeon]|nr:hypothetical protein [Candidatus Woesearchaeota archaeon]